MFDIETAARRAKEASYKLAALSEKEKNAILTAASEGILSASDYIIAENKKDLVAAKGKDAAFIDRLTLDVKRIEQMCKGIEKIAALADPVGEVAEDYTLENGMRIRKVRAPLGVIAIIYEARPNVTADAAALCLKSGNAVILRGSKDAINSNRAIYAAISEALEKAGFDRGAMAFVDDPDREAAVKLLSLADYIDVVIPRGGEGLKKFVSDNAKMPVIASAGGNCHVYVEKSADLAMADKIVLNAKLNRPGVCNAAETLLVDEEIAEKFLPVTLKNLSDSGVQIFGCERTRGIFKCAGAAAEEDYYTEYLALKIAVKVVTGVREAIEHINKYSTSHSEAIVTEDKKAAELFCREVDSAAVYVNVSTRFTDGFEFGMGAEMGISTGKIHARGPIGLRELTSLKYVVTGNGQLRK